jgi:hypothetical protein
VTLPGYRCLKLQALLRNVVLLESTENERPLVFRLYARMF